MIFLAEKCKHPIETGEVFNGLAVDDLAFYKAEFLKSQYTLLSCWNGEGLVGYAVYERVGRELFFRLINCRPVKGGVIRHLLRFLSSFKMDGKPYYQAINATVERPAMGRKLLALGFKNVFQNLYRVEFA